MAFKPKNVNRVLIIRADVGVWYDKSIGLKFWVTTNEVMFPGYYLAQMNPFYEMDPFNPIPTSVFGIKMEHCLPIG